MLNQILTSAFQTLSPYAKTLAATPLTLLTTVSAGLFQDTVWFCNLNGTALPSICIMAVIALLLFIHAIRQRVNHRMFYCDFTVSLAIPVSFVIGSVYVICEQRNFYQESLFKIVFTYLLSKTINMISMKLRKPVHDNCSICLEQLGKEIIQLKCKHTLHQHCIWKWVQTKRACPLCLKPF